MVAPSWKLHAFCIGGALFCACATVGPKTTNTKNTKAALSIIAPSILLDPTTLPISFPLARNRLMSRSRNDGGNMLAVAHAALILAPIHLRCIGPKVWSGDMMLRPDLCAT